MMNNPDRSVLLNHIFNPLLLICLTMLVLFTHCDKSSTKPDEGENDVLALNEFLAGNDTTNTDEYGDFDDWLELYNGSLDAIDIGGMYFSDDPNDPAPWRIPTSEPALTTIQPDSFLLIWCDEEPEEGLLHIDIKLSVSGEAIIIWAQDKVTVVDSLSFRSQISGISWGRSRDGGDFWQSFATPTPGRSNQPGTGL